MTGDQYNALSEEKKIKKGSEIEIDINQNTFEEINKECKKIQTKYVSRRQTKEERTHEGIKKKSIQ